MEINTCGIQDDGSFIVNKGTPNQFCIPDDMGNRHRVMIQEWMDAGNVPEPYVGPTDLENWVEEMARSDKTLLPRTMEDILDGMADKSGVAQRTLDKLKAKKDLRATKP
tara:strand:- start:75 stop:401 length:327 start_codon:yes stop_codon:yes gene_type:complete